MIHELLFALSGHAGGLFVDVEGELKVRFSNTLLLTII